MLSKSLIIFIAFSAYLSINSISYGATMLVAWPEASAKNRSYLEASVAFLGINVDFVDKKAIFRILADSNSMVSIVSADYLGSWSENDVEKLFNYVRDGRTKLMIVFEKDGVYEYESIDTVFELFTKAKEEGFLSFAKGQKDILRELSATRIPVKIREKSLFLKNQNKKSGQFTTLSWLDDSSEIGETMVTMELGKGRLFMTTINHFIYDGKYYDKIGSYLPFIIYIKDGFGERTWHKKTNQANFTIDDPWLIEPYGNLSYNGLLDEMEKANFHTTIAFVPWNYDRSEKGVVEIIINNPDRYSISIHGNNHDHYEFRDYSEVPFSKQEYNIGQAVSRMNEFRKLTGIEYDKVMVFPHNISPERTLDVLKTNEFMGSVNSNITPLGSSRLDGPEYTLMPTTLKYYSFPIVQRYPVEIGKSVIDLGLFLGKPMLFYTHQEYFSSRMSAFNGVAQYVNEKSSKPIKWMSLGGVLENLYVERLRDDGAYDVKMLSKKIKLKNDGREERVFFIKEIGAGLENISEIRLGESIITDNFESHLKESIKIAPGSNLVIELVYKVDKQINNYPVKKDSIRIWVIRMLSDMRDIVISRYKIGRKLTEFFF